MFVEKDYGIFCSPLCYLDYVSYIVIVVVICWCCSHVRHLWNSWQHCWLQRVLCRSLLFLLMAKNIILRLNCLVFALIVNVSFCPFLS